MKELDLKTWCTKNPFIFRFLSSLKKFIIKNTFKVTLQYLFNVFILFFTVSYLKLNFYLKIDPQMGTFKNLEEI